MVYLTNIYNTFMLTPKSAFHKWNITKLTMLKMGKTL